MNTEFYETDCIEDVLMDLFIDHLHESAAILQDSEETTTGSVAQRIEHRTSNALVAGSIPA
jgi:hypothetical protein